jgi:hypothetical protein
MGFKQKFMKYEIAERILSEAAALQVPSIKTNFRGESTMNPNFEQITSLAKHLAGGSTFIDRITNTNMQFEHQREDIFRGLCNQTKVKCSYDSFVPKVFEAQRLGGHHDQITANIDKLYNYKGRDNEIVIQAVRTQANKDEDFVAETRKRWPSATVSIRDVVEGRLEKEIDQMLVKERPPERQSCIQAHVRLIFEWDGTATPCCPDYKSLIKFDNIMNKSMKEIFNSKRAKLLRAQLKDKSAFDIYPACRDCSSHESFAGYKAPWGS